MTALNANNVYFAIDGVDCSALFTAVELERSVEAVDVTHGSGATDMMRAPGLKDASINFTLVYKVGQISSYIQRLQPGVHNCEYGPEGLVSGKPRHKQDFVIESAPFEVVVGKELVSFSASGSGAAAPEFDLYAGAVFP